MRCSSSTIRPSRRTSISPSWSRTRKNTTTNLTSAASRDKQSPLTARHPHDHENHHTRFFEQPADHAKSSPGARGSEALHLRGDKVVWQGDDPHSTALLKRGQLWPLPIKMK